MKTKKIILIIMVGFLMILNGCGKEEIIDGGVTDNTDYDAPKVIESNEICDLNADFYLQDELNKVYDGSYNICIQEDNDKSILSETNTLKIEQEITKDDVLKYQKIIDKYELVKLNGYDKITAGLPPEYTPMSLSVTYKSNEKLYLRDDGDPKCDWAKELLKTTKDLFIKYGHNELKPEIKEITNLIMDISHDDCRYNYVFYTNDDNKVQLLREIFKDGVCISEDFVDLPYNFNEFMYDLINGCDLYSYNNGITVRQNELDNADYYEIYIEFADGTRISDKSNEYDKVEKFNMIKDILFYSLDELYAEHIKGPSM